MKRHVVVLRIPYRQEELSSGPTPYSATTYNWGGLGRRSATNKWLYEQMAIQTHPNHGFNQQAKQSVLDPSLEKEFVLAWRIVESIGLHCFKLKFEEQE